MAVSGTISQTTFQTRKVIDHAVRYCKLTPQQFAAEQLEVARDQLWLLLSGLANRGIQLWCVERKLVPVYEGRAQISALTGTVDVLNANFRLLTRLSGAYSSTAGGTVTSAFDDDFDTILTQSSSAGSVVADWTTETAVTTVGYLPGSSSTLGLAFERSDDATTWTTVTTVAAQAFTDNVWEWFDLDTSVAARYFRVRATSGTISAREIFIGNTPQAVPMSRLNRDDYTAFTNRSFGGKPLQYWFDRQRDAPIFNIWPVTDLGNRYGQIEMWRKRYIMDVGTLPQTLDIPQRWYEAVVLQLASRLAAMLPEVPDERMINLTALADRRLREAEDEERDNSPIKWAPKIGVYTR